MDYAEAVETAPPGWRHFTVEDVDRLPDDVRSRAMARVPANEPDDRVIRALFWTLVYHLEPARWDELARVEPIHPELIASLPRTPTALDVGAGSGRLTEHLVTRCDEVIAVEPAAGLRAILAERVPAARAVHGWAEALPIEDGWSHLTAACGALGPDPEILAELVRVTKPGGTIALLSAERPEWFEVHGWKRIRTAALEPLPHPRSLDDFFGPLDPPHELVMIRVG